MHVLALIALLETKCDIADVIMAGQRMTLEVTNTYAERQTGLMHVRGLVPFDGMIFAYEQPDHHVRFWMKDTPLVLDMFFFDPSGVLTRTHEGAKPFDLTPIDGGEDVQYVVELNAGWYRSLAMAEHGRIHLLACVSKGESPKG